MAAKVKKLIAMLIAVIMCITLVPVNTVNAAKKVENEAELEAQTAASARENKGTIPEEYKKVAESGTYELYLYEKTMAIILKNKATGKVLYSAVMSWEDDGKNNKTWKGYMQSGVVLSAIKDNNDTYQVDLVNDKNTIGYKDIKNGFEATVNYTKYQFGFKVRVELLEDELLVTVPEESIHEDGNAFIGSISLFPMFGETYLDAENGYMLLPDGNGALIYLDNKDSRYSSGFSQVIYGVDLGFTDSKVTSMLDGKYNTLEDAEKVIMPVFGMIHSDDRLGYLGVVEQGDLRASIEVVPNGVMVDYNRCFAKFVLRKTYVQPLNNSNSGTVRSTEADRSHGDLAVRYLLVAGDAADYSGLAKQYRQYLADKGDLVKVDTSYNTRVDFLGSDREKFLFFTTAVSMTTVDEAEEIFKDLKNEGVQSVLSVYKGWQDGGICSLPINKYKADSSIGGTKALTNLVKEAAGYDYDVYLYNNVMYSNPSTSNTTFNAIKKVNKRKYEYETEGKVFSVYNIVVPSKMKLIFNKFLNSYTDSGVNNLALAGVSNNIFAYYTNTTYYNRYDCEKIYTEMVKNASEKSNLILEKPSVYLWKYTKGMLDIPLGSSDYMYEDEEVPFLSMVLKGYVPMYSDYVNFEANKKEFKLKMLEAGVYPSFYVTYEDSAALIYTNSADLYSTKYTTYRDSIIEYDKEFRQISEEIGDSCISRHDRVGEGVYCVTYENGAKLYTNYTELSVTVDNVVVPALSAKVVK